MKYGDVIKRAVDIEIKEFLFFLYTIDIKYKIAIIFNNKKKIDTRKIPIKEGAE